MSKFSMEAFLEINYELVSQRKKIDFYYFKVQVSKFTRIENFKILGFFETNRSVGAKPQKGVQILLQILTPELVGDQNEMMA